VGARAVVEAAALLHARVRAPRVRLPAMGDEVAHALPHAVCSGCRKHTRGVGRNPKPHAPPPCLKGTYATAAAEEEAATEAEELQNTPSVEQPCELRVVRKHCQKRVDASAETYAHPAAASDPILRNLGSDFLGGGFPNPFAEVTRPLKGWTGG
jgi:hypothetical protein